MNKIDQHELKKRLTNFSNLPSIPQIILQIKETSENPKASAADLANCILADHQLTSRILRMANSAYYGEFAGKINTVTQAILMMGFRAVRNITVSMAVYEVVNKFSQKGNFDATGFWTRSLSCGVIAKFLAHEIGRPKLAETAFIAGFMHDIGQAVLAGVFPEQYQEINRMDVAAPDIYKTERAILGIDHLTAGKFVAENWNLPANLVKPISMHHRIDKAPNEQSEHVLVDLVYLGDRLFGPVMSNTVPTSSSYKPLIEEAEALIGVSHDTMAKLLPYCREQVSEIAKELQIDIKTELVKRTVADSEDADVRQELSNKEVQLAFLQNSTAALMEAKEDDEIHQIVCEAAFHGLQMGRVMLFGYNEQWDSFTGLVGFGLESQEAVRAMSFSAKKGLFKHLRAKGEAVSVASDDETVYGHIVPREEIERLAAKAFVALPIKILGKVQFVLFADAPGRETPIADDSLRSLISLISQCGMCLERNLLLQRV